MDEDTHSYNVVINSNPSEWVVFVEGWGVFCSPTGTALVPIWGPRKHNSSLIPHASYGDWHVPECAVEFK